LWVDHGGFSYAKKEVTAMPYRPKKPCAHSGCPNLTDDYFCEKHRKETAKEYNRFRRDSDTAKRYGNEWRKLRARVLQANPLCELCKQHGKYTPATLVHHKRKLTDGGNNDWSNLQPLCDSCHSSVHAKQGDGLNKR
jgi:5-methylcytosine-specific restriction protein A